MCSPFSPSAPQAPTCASGLERHCPAPQREGPVQGAAFSWPPLEGTEAPAGLPAYFTLPAPGCLRLQETKQQRQEGLAPGACPLPGMWLWYQLLGVRTGAQLSTGLLPVRGLTAQTQQRRWLPGAAPSPGPVSASVARGVFGARPARFMITSVCLLVRCQLPSGTCVQLAHQTAYSGRSTVLPAQDSLGQNCKQSLDLSVREKPQTTYVGMATL